MSELQFKLLSQCNWEGIVLILLSIPPQLLALLRQFHLFPMPGQLLLAQRGVSFLRDHYQQLQRLRPSEQHCELSEVRGQVFCEQLGQLFLVR